MNNTVIHQLSLVGIGGVQQSFSPYLMMALSKSQFNHYVYGMHELDINYSSIESYYSNINSSILSKIKFLHHIYSEKYIVHFYNNLGSRSVNRILKLFPSSNIIFHERGLVWNAKDNDINIYRQNASCASVIIANSNATKIMLEKRFGIPEDKIKVVHNGFLSNKSKFDIRDLKRYSSRFCVGYIGRLDTPKGVHLFIESAKKLVDFDFYIAGDGAWSELLKKNAYGHDNIHFIGRVKEPLEFISMMDLIIVPSIREPLGNIIIEAGFCKKPVIASNIDGIAEIIENNYSGVLLDCKNTLKFDSLPSGAVPIPTWVVNPKTNDLDKPKEIDVNELCSSIVELYNNTDLREKYGHNLFMNVCEKFTIEHYFQQLESLYSQLFFKY